MEYFYSYLFFLAKAMTIVLAIVLVLFAMASVASKARKEQAKGQLKVSYLNDRLKKMLHTMKHSVLSKEALKEELKAEKVSLKKHKTDVAKKRVYVMDFHGDIKASAVSALRQEITAILEIAQKSDEVVLRLESSGGMVHAYGLAAAQLQRIKDQGIPLTITVDKVAASGGYMMACIADKIIASPFAVLGSIGVIAQLPNFNRLLKKHDIDFEMLTAGEYKRTLTLFGENTEKGRKKFLDDLEDTHDLFKEFVIEHRSVLAIEEIATGEVWFGRRAVDKKLVDELKTSDQYLVEAVKNADVYEVSYQEKKSLQDRISLIGSSIIDKTLLNLIKRLREIKYFS